MAGIKSLAKDTVIYGLSSIIGRFLNWCLVPLYTINFAPSEYGIVTYLYSIVALALIILTYGMETGFFRFINAPDEKNPMQVYSTSLISLMITSTAFAVFVYLFQDTIAGWMDLPEHPEYISLLAATVAIDAFCCIPFAYLRYQKRPIRFATVKLIGIAINIALNLIFILAMGLGIESIFIANIISTVVTLLCLLPQLLGLKYIFNWTLLKRMLSYSFPLLILGIAGILNQTIDKLLLPALIPDHHEAMRAIGIYGANYKIAIVMVMFIQAFRFAYEPFVFAQNKNESAESKTQAYIDAMKYFIIFSFIIFLAVMYYMPVLKYFISSSYFEGLKVVPIIMLGELFFGICFNLSLWYKLTDRTQWGTYITLIGLAVSVIGNYLLVPRIGYMGCAWTAFTCYLVMMVVSYLLSRKYYPIAYDLNNALTYSVITAVLYFIGMAIPSNSEILQLSLRTILLIGFIALIIRRERIPMPGRRRK